MPDAVSPDVEGPPAPELTAPEPDGEPQPSASRAPHDLLTDKAERQQFCEEKVNSIVKQLRECCRRGGVDFVLGVTWKDAAGQRDVLSDSSKLLKGLHEDIQPDVAMPV
jgi:hypothetical protein